MKITSTLTDEELTQLYVSYVTNSTRLRATANAAATKERELILKELELHMKPSNFEEFLDCLRELS